MQHIYVYNFGAGQKKWCSTCNRGNSYFGAIGYKQYANLKILVYMYSKTFRLSQISTLVRNATLNLIKRVYSGKILKQDLKLYKNILSKYYLQYIHTCFQEMISIRGKCSTVTNTYNSASQTKNILLCSGKKIFNCMSTKIVLMKNSPS